MMYNTYPYNSPYDYMNFQNLNMNNQVQNPNTPRYEIIHVNGENGARALQMAPNSNVLLVDDTAPVVWLAQTDGAGYKTVTAYDITPHQTKPEINVQSLEERIARLEAMMNEPTQPNAELVPQIEDKQQSSEPKKPSFFGASKPSGIS